MQCEKIFEDFRTLCIEGVIYNELGFKEESRSLACSFVSGKLPHDMSARRKLQPARTRDCITTHEGESVDKKKGKEFRSFSNAQPCDAE